MIEQRARVIEAGERHAWVEPGRQAACHSGCLGAALARVLGRRRTRLQVVTALALQAGDEVIIGLEEGALLRGALAVYLVPLATLFLGALLGRLAGGGGEGSAIVLGSLGLLGGFAWVRFGWKIQADSRFQAVVLRLAGPPSL